MSTILVLGDLILDAYLWGDAERISPEAPVPVVHVTREEFRLGGAASVCRLLRSLDVGVMATGVVGRDMQGTALGELLDDCGVDRSLVRADESRCTTSKQRLVGRAAQRHPHQMVRIDREVSHTLSEPLADTLAEAIEHRLSDCHAVLIADYGKGVCTPELLRRVITSANRLGIPVAVDPARGADYAQYQGATVIKPNRVEAELASGLTIETPEDGLRAARLLCQRHELPAVIITLDRDGLVLVTCDGLELHVPTRQRSVYDITGAGDTALSVIGWCLAHETPWPETLGLINAAAGLQVERLGVAPVTWPEIRAELTSNRHTPTAKVVSLDELRSLGEAYRSAGKRVVFTNGCFDLLHVGHLTTLEEASQRGDILVVGVNSDSSIRRLKGSSRPVIKEHERARLLSALGCVSHVVVFDDDTPHELLRLLRPDVLVKGGTYTPDQVVGREVVDAYGGEVCVVGCLPGISTTAILAQVGSGGVNP